MNKKLIIGGIVIAGIVAYYLYNKKSKANTSKVSSIAPETSIKQTLSAIKQPETRVLLTGMRPPELNMPSIAPPRPIMDRVLLTGMRPPELNMPSIAPPTMYRVPLAGLSPIDQFIA
jgi:hypothetical protein